MGSRFDGRPERGHTRGAINMAEIETQMPEKCKAVESYILYNTTPQSGLGDDITRTESMSYTNE